MNDVSLVQLFSAVIPIYLLIAAGWVVRKLKWMTPESDSSLVKFSVDVALPCLIIFNMLGNEKLKDISFSLQAMGFGAAGMSMGMLVAFVAAKVLSLKIGEGLRTFTVTTASHNYGFFVIAMVAIMCAPESGMVGVVVTHNVGAEIVYWSVGLFLLSRAKFSFKFLLRGPIVAVLASLSLIWTGIDVYGPKFAMTFFQLIGTCAIPLNLMIFGTIIYDLFGKEDFSLKAISTAVLIRMFILPMMFILAASLLPIDNSLKLLLVFQALAPSGVMSAVLAKRFGGYPRMAMHIILATCLVSFITIPIWMMWGLSAINAK